MASVRIEIRPGAIVEILQSPEVQADLHRRGEAIQAAAGGEPDFDVLSVVGRQRAATYVSTATIEGMRAEATSRALTRALDAGRG